MLRTYVGLSGEVLERVWGQNKLHIGWWLRRCGQMIRAKQAELQRGGSVPNPPLRFLTFCKSTMLSFEHVCTYVRR